MNICRRNIAKTILPLLVFLLSCTALPEKTEKFFVRGAGQLTVYLNGPEKSVLGIAFVVEEIHVQDAKGNWLMVASEAIRVESHSLVGKQLRLGEKTIPKGEYQGLKLVIGDASLVKERERVSLLVSEREVMVDFDFEVYGEENTTIFLDWDIDRSMPREHLFAPVFRAKIETRELPSLKIYVTNEDSDNVSVINRSVGKVVSTVAVGKKPKGIAASPDGNFIFVANSGSDNISVINTSTNRVVHTINLDFGDQPVDLAIDPSGRNLLVANYRTNSILVIDAFSFQIIRRIEVGRGPVAIGIDTRRNKAYIANSLSNDVTVFGIFSQRVSTAIKVESQPFDVAVDSRRRRVFIINRGSNNLTVIDSSNDRVIGRVTVGVNAAGVAVEPGRDRIFVSKERSNQVLFLRPSLNSITNSVMVADSPNRLILDAEKRKLFVVNRRSNTLTVIDKVTARKEATIKVGSKPFEVVSTE
ncbi:MAG: beta-propeller fold lactonase family protein [Deltaproteobacteria bacterium]|nr:beta-propeller fold lactonase family protein [Deltaproteobacteria bacterium]